MTLAVIIIVLWLIAKIIVSVDPKPEKSGSVLGNYKLKYQVHPREK